MSVRLPLLPADSRGRVDCISSPSGAEAGCDIRIIQELLGHRDVATTMIYLHVPTPGAAGVISPLDVEW